MPVSYRQAYLIYRAISIHHLSRDRSDTASGGRPVSRRHRLSFVEVDSTLRSQCMPVRARVRPAADDEFVGHVEPSCESHRYYENVIVHCGSWHNREPTCSVVCVSRMQVIWHASNHAACLVPRELYQISCIGCRTVYNDSFVNRFIACVTFVFIWRGFVEGFYCCLDQQYFSNCN